jgi:hypothetical protein
MLTTLRASDDDEPRWGILEAELLRMMLWIVSVIDGALGMRCDDLADGW